MMDLAGTHIMHGDCIELMKTIPDKSVDMVLCDLPYGTTACKWDTIIPFDELWDAYNRIVKDNGAIVLFGSEPFSTLLRMSNLKSYRYDWVWEKAKATGNFNAKRQPLKKHETISVFYRKQPTYNPQYTYDKPYRKKKPPAGLDVYNTPRGYMTPARSEDGRRYPTSILQFAQPSCVGSNAERKKYCFHPTQKPVALCEYLIRTYTNEGETVLDNCMGSGTTGVACINTGRNFIGIELDDNFFNISENRLNTTQNTPKTEAAQVAFFSGGTQN